VKQESGGLLLLRRITPLARRNAVYFRSGAYSGLAVVPFLYGGVVQEHHWLNDRQFVDAVAIAMITPGPGYHRRLHRLFGGWYRGCNGSRIGHFLARVSRGRITRTIVQTLG
jgi:Chromate transporter